MFRKKFPKKLLVPLANSSPRPIPVQQSQRVQLQELIEKEKENQSQLSQNDGNFYEAHHTTQSASRFKSQRATLARLTQQQIDKGKNSLEIVLYNCDLEFTEIGCELIDAKRDPVSFIRSFRCFLTSQNDSNQKIQQYLKDIREDFDISDDEKLSKCEKYMRGIFLKDSDQKYQTQTSLIMCMLAIEGFKKELTKILLERLKEYVVAKKESCNAMIVGLVLTQFKFTDQILDEESYEFLFEELFIILNETKSSECREVIVSSFRELSILKQEEAARRIYSMYKDNRKEILKFVNVLCDMSIDRQTSQLIFEVIQEFMENECSIEHYPSMIKYSQYYSESPIDIIEMFREHIKWDMCDRKVIGEIFKLIDKLFKRDQMNIIDKWTSIIAEIEKRDDLRTLDFVILLKIADTNTETELRNVKKIVLDSVTKGLFTERFLKDSFKMYAPIINENSQTLLELLDALQKTRDSAMLYGFLAACYKLLFRISKDTKPIIGSLTNFLCEKRVSLPFSSASEFKITILNIFNDVMNDRVTSAAALLANYKILLRVLDSSKAELTFNEHRLFIEFLCGLVYKIDYSSNFKGVQMKSINENIDSLREHLNMLVVKQTNNPEERVKQLGQISGVKIISAIVTTCELDEVENEEVNIDVESIPGGPIRESAELIMTMITQCGNNQEMLSVLLDEFSNEFKPSVKERKINATFLKWLSELSLSKLELFTLTPENTEQDDIGNIHLTYKYKLDDEQFESPDLAINLGNIVLRERSKHMIVIPSVLKIARLITKYRFGNIDQMGALCAMAIVLPEKFGTEDDELIEDEEIAALQLDLYFYTCNWFREIIGAFSTSEDESLLKLVKRRLMQLIIIEAQLDRLMQKVPKNYLPPFLDFSLNEEQQKVYQNIVKKLDTNVMGKPLKKSRRKDNQKVVDNRNVEKPSITIKSNQFCREMDSQTAILLKEKFILKPGPDDKDKFTIVELIYLLEDVHTKATNAFNHRKLENKGFTDELSFIHELYRDILPNVVKNFYKIIDEMNHSKETSMEIDSNGDEVSPDDNILLKKAFSICLNIFTTIFNCKKLKQEENSEILRNMLKLLLKSDVNHLKSDQELICSAIIEKFVDIEKNAQNLESAINLIDFLVAINSIYRDRISSARISEMAERFLRTRWVDENRKLEQGSGVNTKLEILLKLYVKKATNQIQMMQLVEEMREITKLSDLATNKLFPCISKGNLICMLRIYVRRQSELINMAKSANMNFDFWSTCTQIERELLETVKFIKSQAAFNLFLKNFIVYLRKFNSDGMEFLNSLARNDRNKFIHFVKSVQFIRRKAHGVACELKHLKNNSIAGILPTVRQQFEIFHQTASGIAQRAQLPADSVSTGHLKNFDIDDNDIFSQNIEVESANTSVNTNLNDDDEEEEDENMDTSDDEGNNPAGKKHASFRSRSTIF